ncbi:MAG TPA: O-antigen ligase family protein, partial [Phototrophicaceae bacterium]|nr:O-antigen ligase family protein [Phototrophicaceae bacterium]
MKSSIDILVRPLFIACCTYLLTLGATFNGVFLPDIAALTIPLLGLILIAWLGLRWRERWTWHRTPLDAAIMLWSAAIAISTLANLADWRRIAIGIWYVALYMVIWLTLSDWLANRRLRRSIIVDGILVAGILVLLFGYWQLINTYLSGARYSGLFGLLRPVSIIGNANSLATLLIVILGFAAGRLYLASNRTGRIAYGVYVLATLVMLLLTFSRGGWLGGAAALLIVGGLWLSDRGILSLIRMQTTFAGLRRSRRMLLVSIAIVSVVVLVGLGRVFIQSFDDAGRSTELRTYIWDAALTMFREKPLTGSGLFTFGKGLQRLASMPPLTPHSHAHSLPLHVMAEFGLPGIIALMISLGAALSMMRQNWLAASRQERGLLAGGIGATIGFGIHHLFDTPLMMPAIALAGLLALLVAAAPVNPIAIEWRFHRIAHAVILIVLPIILLASGWWSNRIYAQYIAIIQDGLKSEDYADAAQNLQTVIDPDPAMMIYHWQQGMLYGLDAAINEDAVSANASAKAGINAFERALQNESQNAVLWANLGALKWQTGDQTGALDAFAKASADAPDSWQLALIWGIYAAQANDLTTACSAYLRATDINPDAALHPDLIDALTTCNWTTELPGSDLSAIASLYISGDFSGAVAAWDQAPIRTTQGYILRALPALKIGNRDEALEYLAQAKQRV